MEFLDQPLWTGLSRETLSQTAPPSEGSNKTPTRKPVFALPNFAVGSAVVAPFHDCHTRLLLRDPGRGGGASALQSPVGTDPLQGPSPVSPCRPGVPTRQEPREMGPFKGAAFKELPRPGDH